MKLSIAVLAALACVAPPALAHGDAHGSKPAAVATVETPFGRTGDVRKVQRTVVIDMSDTMRYAPAEVTVTQGETVRLRVRNGGKVMHELVLGTLQDLRDHAEVMRKHPGMEHDEPYMAHVAPGGRADIVWQFTRTGEFHYGCLVPGHFEAGMVGRVRVVPAARSH